MKRRILKIFSLVIVIIGIYNIKSYAAISATSKTVNAGEQVSILVSSNVSILSYKVSMTDAGGLTLKTSSGGTGAGTATITDAKATGMKSLATYTFSTPKVTKDTTYKVKFSASAMEDENFNPVSNDTAVATITVKAPANSSNNSGSSSNSSNDVSLNTQPSTPNVSKPTENNQKPAGTTSEKSTNANLSNLGIKPNDFSGFKPGTTTYNVTVPNNVKEVTLYATAKDSKAKVSGTGYKELAVGKNVFKVVVTAEAGNTKTYKVNITREGEETVVPNTGEVDKKEEEVTNKKQVRLSNIVLDDKLNLKLSPNFNSEVFEYSIDLGEEYKDLEKLDLTAMANIKGAKVEIKGNEELKDGENIITIVVTNPENNEKVSYNITVLKNNNEEVAAITEEIQEESTVEPINNFDKEQEERTNLKVWIIKALIALALIFIICIVILKYRARKREISLPGMFFDENEEEFFDYDISKLNYENPDIVKMENDSESDKDYEVEESEPITDFNLSKNKSKGKHF